MWIQANFSVLICVGKEKLITVCNRNFIYIVLSCVVMSIIPQENQDQEERRQKKRLDREREQRNHHIEMLRQGKKPRYQRKCEYRNNKNISVSIVSIFSSNSKCVMLFCCSWEKGSWFGGTVWRTEGEWKVAKAHKKTQKKECTKRQKKVTSCKSCVTIKVPSVRAVYFIN